MAKTPLMPKATAVWLVDNTALSFEQIAEFCKLHPLEVKGIADGEVAQGIKGLDPISNGQLTRDEIERVQNDPNQRLALQESKVRVPESKRRGPRYTPVSRRQDRPNAILWLVRNHPELKDAQIMRLVGTTKPTIQAIRERTHWNSANLTPMDPVTLGLCSQLELDMDVEKAAKDAPPRDISDQTLLPTEETTGDGALGFYTENGYQPEATAENVFGNEMGAAPEKEEEEAIDADAVFANFSSEKSDDDKGS